MTTSKLTTGVKPLNEWIFARRLENEKKSSGGILLPSDGEKSLEADVIAVGPGGLNPDGSRRSVDVKPGDRVLIGKYSGSEIKLGEENCLFVKASEIIAIIQNSK